MSARTSGRHGAMSSSELEAIIVRNSQYCAVRRTGSGDGFAGLIDGMTGEHIFAIGGGRLPEYSRMMQPQYDCPCTPGGTCTTGYHGTNLVRGWRNILYDLVTLRRVRNTREVRRVLGDVSVYQALDYGLHAAPMNDPNGVRSRL